MNNTKFFAFSSLLFLFLTACDKKETPYPEEPEVYLWGSAQATVNDSLTWEGICSAFIPVPTIDSLYGFSFIKQDDFGIRMHEVYFGHIPLREEKILLNENCITPSLSGVPRSYLSTYLDFDLIDSYYCLNTSDGIEDFLEITEIDFLTKEIKGVFQGSYYIDSTDIDRSDVFFPDTVVFKNCSFHAKYEL